MTTSNCDKKILVTGAAAGLGKAIACLYAKHGWHVLLVDIQDKEGAIVARELCRKGWKAEYYHCDVGNIDSFRNLYKSILINHQHIDVLVNNVGVASAGTLEQTTEEEWQRLITLNLLSCIRGTKIVLPLLKKSKKAHIVNVASFAGIALAPGMMTYNITKAGVIAFSETLYAELAPYEIGVTTACPAFFPTDLIKSMQNASDEAKNYLYNQMKKSEVTAPQVAQDIYQAVNKGVFIIISHKKARLIYRFKRYLPKWYLERKAKKYKAKRPYG